MRFAVWTSGHTPTPAVVEALKAHGVELGHVFVTDTTGLATLQKACVGVPLVGPASNPEDVLRAHPVDCVLLFSYPRLISPEVIERQLFLNCHNSLLPKYRGLHAFTWALIHGETQLGYTLHRAEPGADAGAILCQCAFDVGSDETINDVFRKADALLPTWISKSLVAFSRGELNFVAQDETAATRFPKRSFSDGRIGWHQPARSVHNFIRALAPPYTEGAFTSLGVDTLFLGRSIEAPQQPTGEEPGTLLTRFEDGTFLVQCSDHPLCILEAWVAGAQGQRARFHGLPGQKLD